MVKVWRTIASSWTNSVPLMFRFLGLFFNMCLERFVLFPHVHFFAHLVSSVAVMLRLAFGVGAGECSVKFAARLSQAAGSKLVGRAPFVFAC